ncbi:exonuclease domain-containing protein [Anaerolineales bacterium HSG25]|nr:exonuclease domain-containing protein [Anaerolineales bacterium HSG25]
MDRQQFELFAILIGSVAFFLGFGLAMLVIPWLGTAYLVVIFGVSIMLMMAVGLRLSLFFQTYILGARQLADELTIIVTVNPDHRISLKRPPEMDHLAGKVNAFADRFQTLANTQADQIEQAKADLEAEKTRLATLMSELTEGVLVCNSEGRILLYNNRTKRLLGSPLQQSQNGTIGGFVGLGRSIFGLIDRNVITHALEDLIYRRQKHADQAVAQFVTTATNGQLIRARIAPILPAQNNQSFDNISGFILTLEDVTHQNESVVRRDKLLRTLTEGIRASLANIRTAIETIEEYPDMDADKQYQLRKVISDEALTLSSQLNQTTVDYAADLNADWQLEEMLVNDLLWAIQRRFEDTLEVKTSLENHETNLWLRIDSYSIILAMTHIIQQLKADYGLAKVVLYLKKTGQYAALDLVWEDDRVDMDTLWSWQNKTLENSDQTKLQTVTLRQVAEQHGGEVWCQTDKETNRAYFRLLLPTVKPRTSPILAVDQFNKSDQYNRPEYYDFDLFRQAGQTAEQDQRLLSKLVYTVFDTETTGLNPSGGDEIISTSAIRIVNGRLLRQEVFDQLIDPRRHLPESSIAIHGILPEMLEGQPTVDIVLPIFHRFVENTILVAHNAAFDMRMLQVKEQTTGIQFTNPVLDTLLLSAVLHPHEKDHSLDTVAQRLGITVIGRHTSLGDAIVTGEVFLKMIPLLLEQGITTLAQARNASEQTYQARIKY